MISEHTLSITDNVLTAPNLTLGQWVGAVRHFWLGGIELHNSASSPAAPSDYDKLAASLQVIQEVTMQVFNEFVELIKAVPSVEAVEAWVPGTYMKITVHLSQSERAERETIYAAEREMKRRYLGRITFDFAEEDRRGEPVTWATDLPPVQRDGNITEYTTIIRHLSDRTDVQTED
jgi:hypothetical protein